LLAQALSREVELKESEKAALEKLSRADDRIEGLRAAVARAEAKANSAELMKQAFSPSGSQPHFKEVMVPRVTSVASISSPRAIALTKQASADIVSAIIEADSVSEGFGRARRDSDASEMSNSLAPSEMGSKYFVDQIGSIRSSHRNERTEWQRERIALRAQIDEYAKRKEAADETTVALEKEISDLKLANERHKQLVDSSRTVSETPDGLLYLKNTIFRFITADDDSERETLLPVITMLLKFTPEEVRILSQETIHTDRKGLLGGLLSRWS